MRPSLPTMAACVFAALLVTAPASSRTPDSAERLQIVEDRLAIEQLITADYATALDTKDGAALAALFTPDADFELLSDKFPPMKFKGRDAIAKAFAGPPPPAAGGDRPAPPPMPRSLKRVITNVRISVQKDVAQAVAYYLEISRDADNKLTISSSSYYEDDLKRLDGRWLISRRRIHDGDLPKKAP